MKAAMNGALNLSVLDGWWDEAPHDEAGFVVGEAKDQAPDDEVGAGPLRRAREARPARCSSTATKSGTSAALDRPDGRRGLAPRREFSSDRMVTEYLEHCYVPGAFYRRAMKDGGPRAAEAPRAWKERVRARLAGRPIRERRGGPDPATLPPASPFDVRRRGVNLGPLDASEVSVEIFEGPLAADGTLESGTVTRARAGRPRRRDRALSRDPPQARGRGPRLHGPRAPVAPGPRAPERHRAHAVVGQERERRGDTLASGVTSSARAAGILLHPTSLPGRFGIGDLGPAVDRFLDWARPAGQTLWQVLPLGPTGAAARPTAAPRPSPATRCSSRRSGCARTDFSPAAELDGAPALPRATAWTSAPSSAGRTRSCAERRQHFEAHAGRAGARRSSTQFARAPEQAAGSTDWALFAALKTRLRRQRLARTWDGGPARRATASALRRAAAAREDEIALPGASSSSSSSGSGTACAAKPTRAGIAFVGDVPIYVAHDSADVWAASGALPARRGRAGRPTSPACRPTTSARPASSGATRSTAGTRMAEDGLRLVDRAAAAAFLLTCDLVRIDHFRGFRRVLGGAGRGGDRARTGGGSPGPGAKLFDARRGGARRRCRSSPRTSASSRTDVRRLARAARHSRA